MANFGYRAPVPEGIAFGVFYSRSIESGLRHQRQATWVSFGADPGSLGDPISSQGDPWSVTRVYEIGPGLALITSDDTGHLNVLAHAATPAETGTIIDLLRKTFPNRENPDREKVPVTFWTYTGRGPQSIHRSLDAPNWEHIRTNYSQGTLTGLEKLFSSDFEPGHGGQFILWHGEPGTGKTTALRALAQQWRDWCECHYITDPDNFFGHHSDYMLNVLLRESPSMAPGVDIEKWRFLILEDTGELLQADARQKVGQALSRFLNSVDGMIGQGLRVLVLVTTNEPLGKLHPAVTRPGRSALTVSFESLSPGEASDWLAAHDLPRGPTPARTLADLYAELNGFEERAPERVVGF